ncbi:sigma-54-dependent transcriptional regulator [Mangrovitalea sediminis]|uniref:sigma-54-dependent transcriptional regulator n=1 Tax=Mangrovitalea sediminis TaxID=1982043 RepID=UPI000BE5430A|nr:sigma-54 dependent transcriptional regulator [Mangrovitalea sediminis]
MSTPARILLVDDEPAFCELCAGWLSQAGYQVATAGDLEEAGRLVSQVDPDLVLLDLSLPPSFDPQHTLSSLARFGDRPVIILTGHAQRELALEAIDRGAWDFLAKPVDPDMLAVVVRRAVGKHQLTRELDRLKAAVSKPDVLSGLIGASENIAGIRSLIARIAPTDVPVLVTGPSGTGKEVISRAIHDLSKRREGPFISVHCGAIPPDLLESELFGYKRGAFTGAERDRIGMLALADGGTLFLDEIGEMPAGMQVKLLRVLQEGTFYPVGGRAQVQIDVRLISATNADLPERVAGGQFREDLFYRIKGVMLQTRALDERREDIPLLCEHFLERWRIQQGRRPQLAPTARDWFLRRRWPGNVRELKNTLESVAAICQGEQITLDDIHLLNPDSVSPVAVGAEVSAPGVSLDEQVRALEIRLIGDALSRAGGNRSHAARALGLSRQGLLKKMERYGLS